MSEGRLRALAFFGGGTGGHLCPGIAVAERARELYPGIRTVFVRSGRPLEERILAGRGLESRALDLASPTDARSWIRYAYGCAASLDELRALVARGFDAAVGLGGYASVPGVLAAREADVPVLLLEQNRVPGKVTRLAAPLASVVACADEESASRLGGRARVTGNPVRREVLAAALERRRASRPPDGPFHIVVSGGSQGAGGLNRALREALAGLGGFRGRIRWSHIAGDADKERMEASYRRSGWEAAVWSFRDDLPRLMAIADLAIGRAGGTTLAELCVLGVPSILVPYPHHADRHQEANALALEKAGAAVLLPEEDITSDSLGRLLGDLLDREILERMGARALRLGRPGAADHVISLLSEIRTTCRQASVSFS